MKLHYRRKTPQLYSFQYGDQHAINTRMYSYTFGDTVDQAIHWNKRCSLLLRILILIQPGAGRGGITYVHKYYIALCVGEGTCRPQFPQAGRS